MSPTLSANEFYQLTIGAGNEDNLPRVARNPAAAESGLFTAEFSAGKLFQPRVNHSVVLSARFNARRYLEHSGFDAIGVSASASYTYKFGLGAYAPSVGVAVSAASENIDGDARDRNTVTTEINFQKRLSPAWSLLAGVDYQVSRGKSLPGDARLTSFGYAPGSVVSYDLFDDDSAGLFVELGYEMANGYLLSGGYSYVDGFTVSSTQMPTLDIYKKSNAVYIDPAWPDLWFAYRLQSTTDEWSLDLSIPVGLDSAIDLGASWQDIDGPANLDYENRSLFIRYVHSF